MARISEIYELGRTQASLDFVDVDPTEDTLLFIDPTALAHIDDDMSRACLAKIQSFFQAVVDKIREGNLAEARSLLSRLGEDNSTHLGYSSVSRGSGMGSGLAADFYDELVNSGAVRSGLIQDLEETALMVPRVGNDRISDVVTNIIRGELAEYTEACAEFFGIPVEPDVALGYRWDIPSKSWVPCYGRVPTPEGPLLLVPKSFVRRSIHADAGNYYSHYVLQFLKEREEDNPTSPLARVLRSGPNRGHRRVTKKQIRVRLEGQYGGGEDFRKRVNSGETAENPEILERFRQDVRERFTGPESHARISETVGDEVGADYNELLNNVLAVEPGRKGADDYERAIEALLGALFYPALVNPIRQSNIHDGRKRIDIEFTNVAQGGFFHWLSNHYTAPRVFIECKNYSRPLANPEYDQLSGRFSPSRGRVGLLVYRGYDNKEATIRSCRDTAKDDRGWIIALDDDDLRTLVEEAAALSSSEFGGLLDARFRHLTD